MFWFVLGGVVMLIDTTRTVKRRGIPNIHPIQGAIASLIWGMMTYGFILWLVFGKWIGIAVFRRRATIRALDNLTLLRHK